MYKVSKEILDEPLIASKRTWEYVKFRLRICILRAGLRHFPWFNFLRCRVSNGLNSARSKSDQMTSLMVQKVPDIFSRDLATFFRSFLCYIIKWVLYQLSQSKYHMKYVTAVKVTTNLALPNLNLDKLKFLYTNSEITR